MSCRVLLRLVTCMSFADQKSKCKASGVCSIAAMPFKSIAPEKDKKRVSLTFVRQVLENWLAVRGTR